MASQAHAAGVLHDRTTGRVNLEEGVSMQTISKHSGCGALVLVIALWWAAPMPVHAIPFTPAVEYASFGGFILRPGTVGYQFSTSLPFNVDALAYWDTTPDLGTSFNHQVGLWDSARNPLVSTTVLKTDPIQGHFQFHSILTPTLPAGDYTIGGETSNTIEAALVGIDAQGVVTVPGFTWTQAVSSGGGGFNYPTVGYDGTFGQNSFLAPNFSIVPAAPVPEPSTVLLLASGLVGILGYGWRRKGAA